MIEKIAATKLDTILAETSIFFSRVLSVERRIPKRRSKIYQMYPCCFSWLQKKKWLFSSDHHQYEDMIGKRSPTIIYLEYFSILSSTIALLRKSISNKHIRTRNNKRYTFCLSKELEFHIIIPNGAKICEKYSGRQRKSAISEYIEDSDNWVSYLYI
jgi:hypothetical protein